MTQSLGGIVQAEFASFQIFGGVIFLIIGLQFVFRGPMSLTLLKSKSGVLGRSCLPCLCLLDQEQFSASVVIGKRHDQLEAITVILVAVALVIAVVFSIKIIARFLFLPRSEPLVNRYIEVTGRISALYVGTIAVEMIMKGLETWVKKF